MFVAPIVVLRKRHVGELVRHDRPPRRGLDQRVDMDQLGRAPVGFGQPGEHPWRVRGGVVAISQIASACSQSSWTPGTARTTTPRGHASPAVQ
jgi:hypothetical protein